MLEFAIYDRFKSKENEKIYFIADAFIDLDNKEFVILQSVNSNDYIQLYTEIVEKDFIRLDKNI